jgi:hypothetical protein
MPAKYQICINIPFVDYFKDASIEIRPSISRGLMVRFEAEGCPKPSI